MIEWTLIPAAALEVSPWHNGLGTSRNIVTRLGPDDGALRWQVGIADLAQDGPFSHYPHCDRIFTPIAGEPPPELAFDGGPFEPCPLLVPKHFSGEVPTLSRIPAPGRAFNAIVDRRHHGFGVSVSLLAAGRKIIRPPHAAQVVLHCLTGRIEVGCAQLGPGDSGVATLSPAQAEATLGVMLQPGLAIVVSIFGPAGEADPIG